MASKPTKKQQIADEVAAMVAQMNTDAGRVHCPKCSTPNWKAYHKPNECPKNAKAAQ